jgi:hypothetical protein
MKKALLVVSAAVALVAAPATAKTVQVNFSAQGFCPRT